MSKVRFYIEGGSTGGYADLDFRRGWRKFLAELHELARKSGYHGVEVVRGKGRGNAFRRFTRHRAEYPTDLCVLLVDSETAVPKNANVWNVVKNRTGDGWIKPKWVNEANLYLMVHFVETWLLTDPDALKTFFGSKFDGSQLPDTILESRSKSDIEKALKKATRLCKSGPYSHGHAHRVIEYVRPERVKTVFHGKRLFDEMAKLITGI